MSAPRVSEKRPSFIERRFYVDRVVDERWGKLELLADNLTKEEAEAFVAQYVESQQ